MRQVQLPADIFLVLFAQFSEPVQPAVSSSGVKTGCQAVFSKFSYQAAAGILRYTGFSCNLLGCQRLIECQQDFPVVLAFYCRLVYCSVFHFVI